MNLPIREDNTDPESSCDDRDIIDLRQSIAGALTRVSQRVGGYAYNQSSLNFKDVATNGTFVAQWSAPLLINGLVPGTDASQRVGRQTEIKRILMRLTVGSPCRIVLVLDTQSNGSAPAITDIFQADLYEAEINFNYRDRFYPVFDTCLPIAGDLHLEEDLETSILTFYNSGSAGTVADIATGALYWMINNSTTSAAGTYTGNIRIEYEE